VRTRNDTQRIRQRRELAFLRRTAEAGYAATQAEKARALAEKFDNGDSDDRLDRDLYLDEVRRWRRKEKLAISEAEKLATLLPPPWIPEGGLV
jgi:hypothetical protein